MPFTNRGLINIEQIIQPDKRWIDSHSLSNCVSYPISFMGTIFKSYLDKFTSFIRKFIEDGDA
jgi:hypothetical protein